MNRIELREYETTRVELTAEQQAELIATAGSALQFGATAQQGIVDVTATSKVGTIVTPHAEVLIRPKISIGNLFHLLEAGGDPLPLGEEVFEYSKTGELLPAIAGLFARQVEVATRRGLHRAYRQHDERLIAIRGRIDMAGQIRAAGLLSPLACRFDEYTTDVAENQLLRSAMTRVARLRGVPDQTRRLIAGLLLSFDEVQDVVADPTAIDRIVFTRLNRHYETPLRLAQLILRSSSLVDQAGGAKASVFLVDMNRVFEEFVEHRLRDALRGRLQVLGQYGTHLDVGTRVPIQPDLVFRSDDRNVYVADAKYKLTRDGIGRQADYYQLLAYTTALGLKEGMLIYCHDDGDAPPFEVVVRGSGKHLVTYRLSLAGERVDVDGALLDLAEVIRDRATLQRWRTEKAIPPATNSSGEAPMNHQE